MPLKDLVVRVQTYERDIRNDSKIVRRYMTNIPACSLEDANAIADALNRTNTSKIERHASVCVRFGTRHGHAYVDVDDLNYVYDKIGNMLADLTETEVAVAS